MAISALAGRRAMLVRFSAGGPLIDSLAHFIKGFTLFYSAKATWWFPMLVILAIWRHVYKRLPFTYDRLDWGMVFPLGMYTICTCGLAEITKLTLLDEIQKYSVCVAMAASRLAPCRRSPKALSHKQYGLQSCKGMGRKK